MRFMVTGGHGFIGAHLSMLLSRIGAEVLIVDDHSAPSVMHIDRTEYSGKSVTDIDPVDIAGADAVFHLASAVGPVGVLSHAGRFAHDTIVMADHLATLCEIAKVPLVYVSTSEIYGQQVQPMDEGAPRITAAGHSARMEYAVGKLAAETMLLNRTNLDVRIVRPFNVAGPLQRGEKGFVIPRFVHQALSGDPLTVYVPGTQMRAFTDVGDIAKGIYLAYDRARPGSIYNLGNPDNKMTIIDLAKMVIEEAQSPSKIEIVDPAEIWGPTFKDAPDKIPDIAKAKKELGWKPLRPLREIVAEMVMHARSSGRYPI